MPIRNRPDFGILFALAGLSACHAIPSNPLPHASVWYVSSQLVLSSRDTTGFERTGATAEGGLLLIDSASLRPLVVRKGGSGDLVSAGPPSRFTIVSTFQGDRYHPETIRALTDDSVVMAATANAIVTLAATAAGVTHIMLDFQGFTPDDIRPFTDMVRSIAGVARSTMGPPVAVVVPAGNTVSYPTEVLARVADLLVIRLGEQHRSGTAPGPLATPESIARAIGIRSEVLGPNRLAAELPLFGYRWNPTGTANPVTFAEAQALVASQSGAFRRDQSSQFLTASGRSGWTVWVPDAQTVAAMVQAVRARGVTQILLAGPEGSDPSIPARVEAAVRR